MGTGTHHFEGIIELFDRVTTAQQYAQPLNECRGPSCKIRHGAFTHPFTFAPAFAQQDGRWGIPVWDNLDVHGNMYSSNIRIIHVHILLYTWEHIWAQEHLIFSQIQEVTRYNEEKIRGNFELEAARGHGLGGGGGPGYGAEGEVLAAPRWAERLRSK